ncbi:AAA domain-containing protein [Paenibacillaceae bacterium WGS1546]|uniref:AAA domain-containing protein n=1 Tax=Cohnella sp. WGS1546 TaxID=3366810 RepID=UPI00372D1A39
MNFLKYWRNSLADADWINPDFDKRKPGGLLIQQEQIIQGIIPTDSANKLIAKIRVKKPIYDILLCPTVLYVRKEHGSPVTSQRSEAMAPLWIPAQLSKEGILRPHPRYLPWICREYLEPCETEVEPLGHIGEMDRFLSSRSTRIERWDEYIAFAWEMFSTVTGSSVEEFTHQQYEKSEECYVFANDLVKGVSKSIQDLYDNIERDERKDLKLLSSFSEFINTHSERALTDEESEFLAAQHLGQMGNQFSLSQSQRIAMHHTTLLDSGDILAINGPPGTGKTTLLQSIVATAVIEHAIQDAEPPIIVVSSTNNNAVTNVIESFGKINEREDHPLAGRWIRDVHSYGAYLKSSGKSEEAATNWLTVNKGSTGGSGYFDKMETFEYIERCSLEYLAYCSKFAGYDISDVKKAVELLHDKLINKVEELEYIVQTGIDYKELYTNLLKKFPKGVQVEIENLEELKQRAVEKVAAVQTLHHKWDQYQLDEEWWIPLLIRLPILKQVALRKKELRCQSFCFKNGIPKFKNEEEVSQWLEAQNELAITELRSREIRSAEVRQELEALEEAREEWEECLLDLPMQEGESYLDALDRTIRYEAFKLAVHYWEGRWILETESMLADPKYKRNNGKQGIELLWRRLAKLTPCFVSTLYMTPTFFSAYLGKTVPLYNYIDLLIIDEAGQVIPEVAGASFALAQKAVIVGDTLQIPPVWKIPYSIDIGNCQSFGIAETSSEYEKMGICGAMAADGSVMKVAKKTSKFAEAGADGGLWLTEHRRCVPEIIEYCNELAYHGKLLPKRQPIKDYFLPHMGYAHIPGSMEKRGGSLENELEAEIIVSWIDRNRGQILDYYRKEGLTCIEDIIAIVTPFTSQKEKLRKKLKRAGMGSVKAGTVHTLQGDERPIVIFSPVYDISFSGTYFYDQGVSMLNVAVSRARDSFMVFGDMGTFVPGTSAPSSILAKYLFQSADNEITNIDLGDYYKTKYGPPIEHLHELEHHRSMLRDCIRAANQEIHIISPFLSSVAIKSDDLEVLFDEAIQRGVRIHIYTDEALNYFHNKLKVNYLKAKEILNKPGIELFLTKKVHSKALWVDSSVLVEGSFNWLSAVRQPNSHWCRYETSLVYRGEKVIGMINKLKEDLEKRKINPLPVG